MKTQFTDDQTWKSAFYELAIELGPRSDERLQLALSAIWRTPCLAGCYTNHKIEPEEQDQVEPSIMNLKIYGHLRGIAILPDKQKIPCGTFAVLEEKGPDWLDFYIPLQALMQINKEVGGFFGTDHPKSRCWREPLENWLAGIGREVFSAVEFRLGLIGCEISGFAYASELTCSSVPEVRSIGYLWPTPKGVQYYPTNKW